jgi:hypothetical protein
VTGIVRVSERRRRRATLDVIFLHGLDGGAIGTWTLKRRHLSTFWPGWISDDAQKCTVWSVGYDAWSTSIGGFAVIIECGRLSVCR